MKYSALFSFVIFLTSSLPSYATEQAPDRLVIKGDTTLLHALPLQQWLEQNEWKKPLFPDSLSSFSTGCWRGYVAFWEIIDDRLYLTNIYNGNYSAKVDLDSLFIGKVYDGRVSADWFTDTVTAYQGKRVYYLHAGFSSIYEDEYEHVFEKGELIKSMYFDNSLSTSSMRTMPDSYPTAMIDSLVDWKSLPQIEGRVIVTLHVELNKLGQVDSVLSIYGANDVFNQEALRVAPLLTGLPVTYKRGALLKMRSLVFFFTRKKQQQFLLNVQQE